MTNSHEEFSVTVAEIKKRTKETNAQLGVVIGVTQSSFAARLRNERQWTIEELGLLAGHWGVEPADLVMGWQHAIAAVASSRIRGSLDATGHHHVDLAGVIDRTQIRP